VRGHGNRHLGYITRTWDKAIKNHVLNKDEPFYHFAPVPTHIERRTKYRYIVEDWLSAEWLAYNGVSAISLNGTNMGDDGAVLIAKHYPFVVVSLDRDATRKGANIIGKYCNLFKDMQLRTTEVDWKYKERVVI
jgi:hypothetical protein